MRIAIIPARGGSKEIPRKNIKLFAGEPLIKWTIKVACNSKLINKVIVSTDDEEIAKVSISYGAEVPFLRPAELSTDESPTIDTVLHYLNKNPEVSEIILLQPTSPLRTTLDINKVIEKKIQLDCDSIASITEAFSHPSICYRIASNGEILSFMANHKPTRRQDLHKAYCLNGSIYLANSKFLVKHNTFVNKETIGYVMPQNRSIDIDTLYDWEIAEILFKKNL